MRWEVARFQFVCRLMVMSFTAFGGIGTALAEMDHPSTHLPPVARDLVDRYLLTPQGHVEGLLLRDGSQLYITPRAADSLVHAIRPGDRIEVHGRRRFGSSPIIQPDVIVNVTKNTRYTVPSRLDLSLGPMELGDAMNQMTATGTIDLLLYDSLTGKIRGLLLSDGTQVRLPPDVSETFRQSLPLHAEVTVEGNGTRTPYGASLEALAIGARGKALTFLTPSTAPLDR